MWDLFPATAEPVPVVHADMAFVALPESSESAVLEAFERAIQAREESGGRTMPSYPPVGRVVYGEVPKGYREAGKARPLIPTETYYVLVFVGGGPNWVRVPFVA